MAVPRPTLVGKGSIGGRGRMREDQRKGGFGGGTVGGGGKGKGGGGGGYSRPAGKPKGVGGQGALGNKKPPAVKGSDKRDNGSKVAGSDRKYLIKDRKRR